MPQTEEPHGTPVKPSIRSQFWRACRASTWFLRGTPLQPIWSWFWDREFRSLIADQDATKETD